jgi:predicted PurR-regulated permease PerM
MIITKPPYVPHIYCYTILINCIATFYHLHILYMTNHNIFSNAILKYLLISALTIFAFYVGETLFIPMFYGLFIAIVLYPLNRWLEQHHFPKSVAISLGLLLVMILFAILLWLLVLQFNAFRQDIPALRAKVGPSITELQNWVAGNLNLSVASQNEWWQHTTEKLSDNTAVLLAGTFNKTASGLFMLFIIPVFAALFLYNRNDFILFLEKLMGDHYKDRLHNILHKTINTYFHFIKGMVFVYIIVGVLNSLGLLALGIKHAILFGFLTAIMTIIPYLGIFISALLPITVAWITKDSIWYPLGVIAVFSFVQYLEANVIFPRVVASQLNVSTWATLVAVIGGGILWGVNGMILFIPFVAILKMVTDYIPEWEALNVLLRRSDEKKK